MKYRRVASILDTRVGTELIAFDVEKGVYHHFNATGTAIWDALESPLSEAELVAVLTKRFGTDAATIAGETAVFLRGLIEKRVIVAVDDAAA